MTYVPPPSHRKWEMPEADTGRINSGKSADAIARVRMLAAEEDDSEACLDDAGSSREGDEFEWTPEIAAAHADALFVADTRCARCSEGADLETIIHGHEEMMLAYADLLAIDDQVWALMRQQYTALLSRL